MPGVFGTRNSLRKHKTVFVGREGEKIRDPGVGKKVDALFMNEKRTRSVSGGLITLYIVIREYPSNLLLAS